MSSLYEIVELANGDIALQREGDSKGQPLVTMRFSTELLRFLQGGKIDIAKTMIEAGLEHVAEMTDDVEELAAAEEQDLHQEMQEMDDADQDEANVPASLQSHSVH